MSEAQTGSTVKVHYTGKLTDGTVFDTSQHVEPVVFVVGSGEIIPGFEQAIIGMQAGESKTVTIPCNEAYGPKRDDLVAEVERKDLPDDIKLEVGQKLQVGDEKAGTIIVSVVDLDDERVKLDANHPLAGEDLVFDIEVLEVN
ncbi:MAG: peptidylprolyl isomerase [Chlamydiales bacterium]|nr:peptidylprolyl isomerase [Chlamydiales bacterium]